MKETFIMVAVLFCLVSCESAEDKQKLIDAQIQQQLEQEEIRSRERAILEEERAKQKAIELKKEEEEKRIQDELLWDSLLEETSLMNKKAKDLLESELTGTGITIKYDLITDSSLTKFVNNKVSFTDLEYTPESLVAMEWEYIEDAKWGSQLRSEALEALDDLAQNYYLKFGVSLKVVSAYRGYEYQKWIKDRWCDDTLCAKAWYSEHQSGLAVDFWETTEEKRFVEDADLKKYFEWMKEEAYKFWFTNTYQRWVEIDWYQVEPWHWRYVWKDLALILQEYNITFAEYILSPEDY